MMFTLAQALQWIPGATLAGDGTLAVARVHSDTRSLQPGDLYLSLAGFVVFYTALFIIEITLMFKYARLGPSSLHTGRYHHEQDKPAPALTGKPAA